MFSCTSLAATSLAGHGACLCHRPEIRSLTQRINADLSRRGFVAGMAGSIAALGLPFRAGAQPVPATPSGPILFTNFRLFDGKSAALREGLSLLVDGNLIKAVAGGNPAAPDWRAADRLRRPGHHAGPDRRALAYPVCRAADLDAAERRYRLHLPRRQCRGRAHADARLHHGPGSRRPGLRLQAGDRRRPHLGPAHLSVRCHDHGHRRARRPAPAVRCAERVPAAR